MTVFIACREHVLVDNAGLDHAQARANQLNANGRADLRLCQNLHIAVEALTADAAKAKAAEAERAKVEQELADRAALGTARCAPGRT